MTLPRLPNQVRLTLAVLFGVCLMLAVCVEALLAPRRAAERLAMPEPAPEPEPASPPPSEPVASESIEAHAS